MSLVYAPLAAVEGGDRPGRSLSNLKATLGGVVFGQVDPSGVRIHEPMLSGWFDSPASTGTTTERAATHGGRPGPAHYGPRVIELKCRLVGKSWGHVSGALDRVMAAIPLQALDRLTVYDHGVERTTMVRQEGDPLVSRRGAGAEVSISLVAPDPRRYHPALVSRSTGLPFTSGGLDIVEDTSAVAIEPAGWTPYAAGDSVAPDDAHVFVGTEALRLARTVSDPWPYWMFADLGGDLLPDTAYTVAVYLWVPAAVTTPGVRVSGGGVTATVEAGTAVRDDYARVDVTFTTAASPAAGVFVYVGGGTEPGEMWIDEATYSVGDTALPLGGGLDIVAPGPDIVEEYASGILTLVNDGNMETPGTFVVRGPCPPFTLTHLGTRERVRYHRGVAAGRLLYLTSGPPQRVLEGTDGSPEYATRSVLGQVFDLGPGVNQVRFDADTFDERATVTAQYRSADR